MFPFSPGCEDCCGNCAEALFQWFDCGNCDEEFPCFWWLQFVTQWEYEVIGPGVYSTPSGQLLIGPITSAPGPVACMQINDDADIEVTSAGYIHMLPNSGSATATVNGNAAYAWSYYNVGDVLVGTYNMPTAGNPCLDCHPEPNLDCITTHSDVVPPFNP